MIQKLHKKFLLINMMFVASILAAVLGILYVSNARKHAADSHRIMAQAVSRRYWDRSDGKTGKEDEERRTRNWPPPPSPLFVVQAEETGAFRILAENNITVEEETALSAAALADAAPEREGILKDYSFRYLKADTPAGMWIVFLDQSYEINVMRNLAVNCLAIFFTGNFLFFLLSLYLSRWALKPVEKAWEQQNQFIADASHELKTPLTVILANLQILSAHKDSTLKDQEKWLDNTQKEASRMKQLVEELLFLARSDAGMVSLAKAEFDLSDTLVNSFLLFESVAFEQKVTLEVDVAPGIRMVGNESQIRRLIGILLDNACKYAGKGGRALLKARSCQGHITVEVFNTGEPIPPEEQSRIFERFYRSDKSRARREGGYGLGLSIAQTITLTHGGRITVTSSAEEGTTFAVHLSSAI